jgi:methylmalonyl-CoA mutase cobalamin-binding subunit
MSGELRLFDADKFTARKPLADRMASEQRAYERAGVQYATGEIDRAAPYLVDRLANLAVESTLVIAGVEIPLKDARSRIEA